MFLGAEGLSIVLIANAVVFTASSNSKIKFDGEDVPACQNVFSSPSATE
jgi:hypothetical protein